MYNVWPPSGYHYDARLSICIQSAGSCSNSPCSFGCSPLGRQAFSCDCPQGYHSVGDGHCVSTVNPSGFSSLSSTWDYDQEEEEEEEEEYISTEGCFSCQINGFPGRKNKKSQSRHSSRQGRRRRNRRSRNKRSSHQLSYKENMLQAAGVKELEEVMEVMEVVHFSSNISVHLMLDRQQTHNRQRVVKLQSAREDLGHSVVYTIVKDPSGVLAIKRKAGIWGLFFRQRVSQPMVFHVRVKGELKKGPTSNHNFDLHALFKIEIS